MSHDDLKKVAVKYLYDDDCNSLIQIIGDTFKLSELNSKSVIVTQDIVNVLGEILRTCMLRISKGLTEESVKVAENIYRALRNSTVNNVPVQNWIVQNDTILKDTKSFCLLYKDSKEPFMMTCIKILIQFLNNLVVKNEMTANVVWSQFKYYLPDFISNKNYTYCTSALAYNILHLSVNKLKDANSLLRSVFNAYRDFENNEYLHFLIELFVKDRELNFTYVKYDIDHRLLLLTILLDLIQGNKFEINQELIRAITTEFKQKSDCILKTVTDYMKDINPVEITLLLDVIAAISSNDKTLIVMQNDKSLLINVVFLLKSLHEAGKQPDNNFTILSKLSDLSLNKNDDIKTHPSYGFKGTLIRVIGNMCWKHHENQEEVRQLDAISLLMDCCSMDARNPFIIQWVVFTVRNLCEGNARNQKYIASMTKLGIVDGSTLEEMGLTLHDDGENCIKLLPIPSQKGIK